MVSRVSKSRFKAQALELFRQVEVSGEPIIVTDHGQPTVEIRRYADSSRDPLARLSGTVLRYDRPTEPVGDDEWEAAN